MHAWGPPRTTAHPLQSRLLTYINIPLEICWTRYISLVGCYRRLTLLDPVVRPVNVCLISVYLLSVSTHTPGSRSSSAPRGPVNAPIGADESLRDKQQFSPVLTHEAPTPLPSSDGHRRRTLGGRQINDVTEAPGCPLTVITARLYINVTGDFGMQEISKYIMNHDVQKASV